MTNWISLNDYSKDFDVSISTLRRRIKANKAEFKFKDGKYLLKNSPLDEHHPNTQLNHHQKTGQAPFAPPQESQGVAAAVEPEPQAQQTVAATAQTSHFWVTVNAMMNELKKAYSLILQEKEEQILQLKDEHSDLRTLIRVLEEENLRLKRTVSNPESLDRWLERTESI